MAGFILSACVGAVNLAEGAVENTKSNTKEEPIVDDKDPEPIVVDPEAVLINRCIIDDNLKDSSCAPIVDDTPCIRDPFGVACDITFTNYYKTAQANRISFCRENSTNNLCVNAIKNVCTDNPLDADLCFNDNTYHKTHEQMCESEPASPRCQTTVSRICDKTPFDALCNNHPTYEPIRIADCITAGNAGETRCTGAFTAEHCALNPFGAGCDTQSYSVARAKRFEFCTSNNGGACAGFTACVANPYGEGCGTYFDYRKIPNAANWLKSFEIPLSKVPNIVNPKNEFLQDIKTGLDFGEIREHYKYTYNPTINTLTIYYRDRAERDNKNGVAFFNYGNHYAGILSGTDLGAPITETEGTAMWNGYFRTNGSRIFLGFCNSCPKRNRYVTTGVYKEFVLTINFGAGEQAGTIGATVSFDGYIDYDDYLLEGNFDSSGIITGTVKRPLYHHSDNRILEGNATLTGLIGEEGAVGAFISDETGKLGYSGGFVASPPE